jgi:hypothetical protein
LDVESLNSPLVRRTKSGKTQDTLKPNRLQDEFSLIRSDLTLLIEAMVMGCCRNARDQPIRRVGNATQELRLG